MFTRTKYLRPLLRPRVFCRFFKMPFYVIVKKASNVASITDDWEVVQVVSHSMTNVSSKKFDTFIEAEKYVKDHKFKLMSFGGDDTVSEKKNEEKELKRKRVEDAEEHTKQIKSIIKDHIKKIKMSFNGLQIAISAIPEFSSTCPEQIQTLNDKVAFKLHKILKIKKQENQGNDLPSNKRRTLGESQESPKESQPSSSSSLPTSFSKLSSSILTPLQKEEAKKTFSYNENNEVIVYCDGSCTNNGNSGASAGAGVWFGMNHFLNRAIKVPGLQTNNCAEIYSIVNALERVKAAGLTKINIRTDSQFVIKSVNEWVPKWKMNGWRTASGSEVKNKQLFMVLLQNIESMDSCTWTYVPAHKGITGNEEADKLAKAGAKM